MKLIHTEPDLRILEKAEAFRGMVSEEVYQRMRLCRFRRGEYLYQEGKTTGLLLIILDGQCKVFKTLENGKSVLLCRYGELQILGELELFGSTAVTKTSVQALVDTYCMAVSAEKDRDLLLSDNLFLRFALSRVCAKTERNNLNLAVNLMYPLEQRVAGYVLAMQKDGEFSAHYTMLAEYMGCSLRHLLRTLCVLCDKQMLQKSGTVYHIRNANALAKLAGSVYRQ